MTTFTAWKFDTPDGAEIAEKTLRAAESEGLVHVIDRARVSWPADAKRPTTRHSRDDEWRGTGWGAFWGLLFGVLFFFPVLGVAAGALIGLVSKAVGAAGITADQIDTIREQITPGTSALFAVTEDGDLDAVGERFHGGHGTLVSSNLTAEERKILLETFDS